MVFILHTCPCCPCLIPNPVAVRLPSVLLATHSPICYTMLSHIFGQLGMGTHGWLICLPHHADS